MDKRLLINLSPGNTFFDKLTGETKVKVFFSIILLLISTWDIRIILPCFIITLLSLISIKPSWKIIGPIAIFVLLTNLLNLFLIWVVQPNYGLNVCGGSTILFQITPFYIISAETLWYFLVRFLKMMATFLVAMTFIQTITPSELAAGLYSIKVPYKVCMIVSIAFRYIPDITRDFQNIKISMQARGMELDGKKTSLWTRLKQNVIILVPLIITSFDRVGNIANAMDLRGFGKGKTRTYYSEHDKTKNDYKVRLFYRFIYALIIVVIIWGIIFKRPFLVWCPWVI